MNYTVEIVYFTWLTCLTVLSIYLVIFSNRIHKYIKNNFKSIEQLAEAVFPLEDKIESLEEKATRQQEELQTIYSRLIYLECEDHNWVYKVKVTSHYTISLGSSARHYSSFGSVPPTETSFYRECSICGKQESLMEEEYKKGKLEAAENTIKEMKEESKK